MPKCRHRLSVAFLCVSVTAVSAKTPLVGDSVHAARTLFTWRDAVLAGGFVALTIGMFPVDRAVATRLQDSTTQASRFLRDASRGVQYIADPGSVIIGVTLYGVGRAGNWREVADLGLHGTEAIAIAGLRT